MGDRFIGYRGDEGLHDGRVLAVARDGDEATVVVAGGDDARVEVVFSGVVAVAQHRAVGMLLFGLAEMEAPPPCRRFVFVNWDEGDDATLEVLARDVHCTTAGRR